jgi:hypothetical protein
VGTLDQAATLKIRNRLQAIEDELIAAGLDEFIVAIDPATFTWKTVEPARVEHGKEPPPAVYASQWPDHGRHPSDVASANSRFR